MGDDILSTRTSLSLNRSNASSASRVALCRDEVCEQAVKEGYNAADNAEYWLTRPVPVIARCIRIASEVLRWKLLSSPLGSALLGSGGGGPAASPALLLQALIRLGPAFVKIGQALSSRPDILPPEFQVELEKLQDRIPPFPTVDAFIAIERELGRPVDEVYASISPEPVAAASLGQVYRAALAADGREVAVKVQRPGVVEMIAMDVFILRYLALALRRAGRLNTDLPALVDEWATSLFKELDYNREAANAVKFKALFLHMPEIYVPEVYNQYTTTGVMTMEWIEGERLRTASTSDNAGRLEGQPRGSADDLALVEVGVRCSLEQMMDVGFYHADPHPGNLLKLRDGRLAYLDFGMMGQIDAPVRDALVRATLHLVNREYAALADDFVTLGFLPPGSDRARVVPALTGIFQRALEQGVSNLSFGDLSLNLGRTMYEFKFRIPAYYTLLVRSLTVLEGIALASDPNYKVLSAAYPWVARRLLTDRSPELRKTLLSLLYKDGSRFQFSRLEALLLQAAKVKALGQMRQRRRAGSQQDASSLKLLLSPEGDLVRDILLDEVAKGIDAGWRLSFDAVVEEARSVATRLPSPPLPWLPYSAVQLLQEHPAGASPRVPQLPALALPFPRLGGGTTFCPEGTSGSPPSINSSTRVEAAGYWGVSSGLPWPKSSSEAYLGLTGSLSYWAGSGSSSGGVMSPLLQLLAAVPKLSSVEDKEQVQGLTGLAAALYSIAVTQQPPQEGHAEPQPPPVTSAQPGLELLLPFSQQAASVLPRLLPEPVAAEVLQAAAFLRWLVAEMQSLPAEERGEALTLPLQLFNRVSSRIAARAIRGTMGE